MFEQLFKDAVVAGVPLLSLVIGLVQTVKGFISGVRGKVISLVIGLALGAGYEISKYGVPATAQDWATLVVLGLALGITASGLYDAVNASK